MSETVYKYQLRGEFGPVAIAMPEGAVPLSVGVQGGNAVALWAKVDPTRVARERWFAVLPTGYSDVPVGAHFIGTFLLFDGQLVGHVFETPRP